MLPGQRSKMGRAASDARKPQIFTVFRWVQQRTSYRKRCAKYAASSWGTMLKMRHSKTQFWSFIFGAAVWVEVGVRLAFFGRVQKRPELRKKWGFHVSSLEMATQSSKSGSSKNCQNLLLGPRPSSFSCFWVSRLDFTKQRVLKSTGFAETTESVVPTCRGWERNFCTGGSEMGYFRSGSNMVLKYFSFQCASFPIHLQEDKENCFISLAFFVLDNRPLSIYLMIEVLLCNKYLSLLLWFWQIVWLLVGCVSSFLLVPLLLIISLIIPFSLLNFVLLYFFLLSFFFFGFYLVFLLLSSFCSSLMCPSHKQLCYSNVFFLSCFFACISINCSCCCGSCPRSSSFSYFGSYSPPSASASYGKQPISHLVCLWGIFAHMSFHNIVVHRTYFRLMLLEYVLREKGFILHLICCRSGLVF